MRIFLINNLFQVDIFGVCPTSFKTRKESGNVVITKYRDLNNCAHREQGKNDLIAAIYNPNAVCIFFCNKKIFLTEIN